MIFVVDESALPADVRGKAACGRPALLDVDGDGQLDLVLAAAGGVGLLQNDGGRFERRDREPPGWPRRAARLRWRATSTTTARPICCCSRPWPCCATGRAPSRRDGGRGPARPTPRPPWPPGGPRPRRRPRPPCCGRRRATACSRNNGDLTFTDVTAESKLGGPGPAAALVATDYDNRRDLDLFVARAEAAPALFKNRRDGTFEDVAGELGLTAANGAGVAAAGTRTRTATPTSSWPGQGGAARSSQDGRGGFTPLARSGRPGGQRRPPCSWTWTPTVCWTSWRGAPSACGPFATRAAPSSSSAAARQSGPGAGRLPARGRPRPGRRPRPRGAQGADGSSRPAQRRRQPEPLRARGPHRPRQQPHGHRSQGRAAGGKPPPEARDLRVDARRGPGRRLRRPGRRDTADVVRVIWTSGIVQTETELRRGPAGKRIAALAVTELDRKPSSCPYLFAWDGTRFAFVSDFLGAGEMGYWLAPRPAQHARPRRVRAPRPGPARGEGRALRAARDERARGDPVPRPRAPAGRGPS